MSMKLSLSRGMEMKNVIRKIIILTTLVFPLLITGCIKFPEKKEFSLLELQRISVLNTLSCSFKNVVIYEAPQSFFWMQLPSEKYFLEYTATIDIGIDMKEIEYDESTKTIKIPKTKVLTRPKYDLSTMKEYRYQKPFMTNLDINNNQDKLSESLSELTKKVEENSSIMDKAQGIALNQIESLINNVYTVAGRKPDFKYVLKK